MALNDGEKVKKLKEEDYIRFDLSLEYDRKAAKAHAYMLLSSEEGKRLGRELMKLVEIWER